MNAYTVSRLALDAGVSVHIVRDYLLRCQSASNSFQVSASKFFQLLRLI